MRHTFRPKHSGTINWKALRDHPQFLYRRVADQDRAVLGVGVLESFKEPIFNEQGRVPDWLVGYFRYDLKDALEQLHPRLKAEPDQDPSRWWTPRWVLEWNKGELLLHCSEHDRASGEALVEALHAPAAEGQVSAPANWTACTTRSEYLERAGTLLDHIQRGDIYEVNYCTTRLAQLPNWDPFTAFGELLRKSGAPFAGFMRMEEQFTLCASPERYLAFEGDRIVGQPMKGTRPRSQDPVEDMRLAEELASDNKERSENIMALDVMRHDLARIAASGTVHVDELCGVHSYAQVHQMVSTVSARSRSGISQGDAARSAFPMASMTGAPKFRAMQLIDAAEDRARGLFSGSLGFFAPDGTADLNVVIRTVLYNATTGLASLSTGSALTAQCDPQLEWEECELKARSVIQAFGNA